MNAENHIPVDRTALEKLCSAMFQKVGLTTEDADLSAQILVSADARGIPSHGVGRMMRYIKGIECKQMLPDAIPEILHESPVSITIDANGAMGFPVSYKTMQQVISKAEKSGMACGCIRNSNHFGIAGYYAMMALEHDMIGIAMTNTAALGVPTFGKDVMFGTNPLAFCAPADREYPFVLDMATTTVTRGKLEVYERTGQDLPSGWAVDASGLPAADAGKVLRDMLERKGGGILPLGGFGELFSGYKGYGLAVMVDILCAMLAGAPAGPDVFDTPETSARVSHFFGAVKISAFTDPAEFRKNMDDLLFKIKNSPKADGCDRIYIPGEKEFEAEIFHNKNGIPIDRKSFENLQKIAEKYQIEMTL